MYDSRQIEIAAERLQKGNCIIYPTETLYALGCSALYPDATSRICKLKSRPVGKPLPVIIGNMQQLNALTEVSTYDFFHLIERFWPGPLSILVPGKGSLPAEIRDSSNMVCVRYSSSYIAQKLCISADLPLIASSANKEGDLPPVFFQDVNPHLSEQVDQVLTQERQGGKNIPSTIVKILDRYKLQVIRQGAISRTALEQSGYTLVFE